MAPAGQGWTLPEGLGLVDVVAVGTGGVSDGSSVGSTRVGVGTGGRVSNGGSVV